MTRYGLDEYQRGWVREHATAIAEEILEAFDEPTDITLGYVIAAVGARVDGPRPEVTRAVIDIILEGRRAA